MNEDLALVVPDTDKNDIKHPKLSEQGVIPKLGSSILLVGKSGSGKSVLLYNLLKDKRFYGSAFKRVFLCSPTGDFDDTLQGLELPEGQIFTDLKQAAVAIGSIHKAQAEQIQQHGNGPVAQYALALDDVIGDTKFMGSPSFLRSFIAPRHFNFTTFLCSQHLRKVPKAARLQAAMVCLFACSRSEMDTICEEYCPSCMSKQGFEAMLERVWNEGPHEFVSIHLRQPLETRYRHGLNKPLGLY